MRKTIIIVSMTVLLATAMPALAELQNIEVGGSVRIRGNYISNVFTAPMPAEPRWVGLSVLGRPIGGPFNPNVMSIFDWDNRGPEAKFVEQRTRLNVKADFTDDVSAFIELDSYDNWGEDFRSNYITGVDARAASVNDVEVFQAYIEANDMWGTGTRLRIGRQELRFGSEWLVGARDFEFFFTGISFDAVRLTYTADTFTIDGWWSKLADHSPMEEDGDIDFYGIYATYTGLENITLDTYWMLVRDAVEVPDTPFDLLDLDDCDTTNLHTIGLRAAGTFGAHDFNAELAYQFGEADKIGTTFRPFAYGDDDADFSTWGATVEMGYSFDYKCHPRVFLGATYFGGEDNRDLSFWEWLNPFDPAEASVSFNRLFSNVIYSGAMDLNNDLSNAWVARVGVMGALTEELVGIFCLAYFESVEPFERPVLPLLTFWTEENDSELGLETEIFLRYNYSEDLTFEAGWMHLFVGDGLEDGSFSRWNGLLFNGGTDDDDADYLYIGSKISF